MQVGVQTLAQDLWGFLVTKIEFTLKVFIFPCTLAIVGQATVFHLDSKLLHISLGFESPIFWQ